MTISQICLVIFLILGDVYNLLCCKPLHEFRDYGYPILAFVSNIIVCICMSWAMPFAAIVDGSYDRFFEWPMFIKKHYLFHSCIKNSDITFEETYPIENGEQVHHTYRVYTCRLCGRIKKEQLQ